MVKREITGEKNVSRGGLLKELMSGSMLTDKIILRHLWYILFISILGAFYIGSRFHAESLVRRTTLLQKDVKELRSEALSVSAELNSLSRQSEVIRMVRDRGLGLEELREPPYIIVVRK